MRDEDSIMYVNTECLDYWISSEISLVRNVGSAEYHWFYSRASLCIRVAAKKGELTRSKIRQSIMRLANVTSRNFNELT